MEKIFQNVNPVCGRIISPDINSDCLTEPVAARPSCNHPPIRHHRQQDMMEDTLVSCFTYKAKRWFSFTIQRVRGTEQERKELVILMEMCVCHLEG